MDVVSVRDENSHNINKNLIGVDAPIVCDPVILYGYSEETKSFNPKENKYSLIYSSIKNIKKTR